MATRTLQGRIFVVSAPSGAGKTTLVNRVIQKYGINYQLSRVVTYTTRKPRPTEINGKDYHFLTLDEFKIKEANHFFLEITQFNNNYYGSPAEVITKAAQGESFIFITDLPGAHSIKELIPEAFLVWIIPPNLTVLRERLIRRPGSKPEEIEQRLTIAQQEISAEAQEKFFDYHLINDKLEVAAKVLGEILIQKIESITA